MIAVDEAVWGPSLPGVAALERELARVRRGRVAHAREQAVSVARAAVVNVVVIATRDVHALRAAETIGRLAMRHPSRAIVVLADRRASDATPPSLSLHARLGQGRAGGAGALASDLAMTAYEQVLVRARGSLEDRLSSVVVPLLVPDLPLFVWWTETPPVGARHFEDLVSLAHRLVVDSADFARPTSTLPALASMCVVGVTHCAVTDLNWARLTPWRELVTQCFDVPAWRAYLDGIDGVRVGFAVDADGRDIHPSQALLVVGWLASRLGWLAADPMAPSEAGGHLFAMRRADGGRVRIRVRPRFERGMAAGDVSGILIEGAVSGRRAEFRVRQKAERRYAATTVRIAGELVAERIVPLPRTDVVELLGEELTILASDTVYEDALGKLVSLA